ncbi:hydroxymethylpyrimidine/phosphomethylpyrimidine kinase [Limnobacter sp.]|uniref:bifunctional hydroxymethylpyrimidine kinase/phosphomethylpyrimidine kinase n=1 Tax=Limnobacter sp. TaxID=2003368 RepID=UPI002E307ED6|nr:hydroxymethylpyrimidine/phosphomethylpyrimidine kinase [Limnobacter sp.]
MNAVAPLVMTFSASDPTGGAGMQADALTISALGAHPLTVLTGLTAQNTVGVDWFEPLSEEAIGRQLNTLLADVHRIGAVKAGVLGSVGAVSVLAGLLRHSAYAQLPLVLDPVMASGRGDRFGQKAVFEAMQTELFGHCTLLTPNWPEAKALSGKRTERAAADYFLKAGCQAVLIKGEHKQTAQVVNTLYLPDGERIEMPCARLPGQFHGSGCTLASACAVGLARGLSVTDAVALGLEFTWGALSHAIVVGQGQLIPDRMHLMQTLHAKGGSHD